ncbi:MAG TPA: TRAP transporter small permease [Casimicrobiaceae bacterium]|nr:TRAP transporter small permease [Casimicrobiaceae bacterium]
MRAFLHGLDRNGERYLMLVLYCFIVFVIVTEVIRRFVLDFSSLWGEEAARMAFIYLGWVGASYGVKERAHIRFDIVTAKLSPRLAGCVLLFSELATLVFAGFALYWSLNTIGTMLRFDALSPALRISQAWFQAAVPLGFAMMVVRVIQSALRDIRNLREGRPPYLGTLLFD